MAGANWLGPGSEIVFEPDDFEVLNLVVGLKPELGICALAVKRARQARVTYPIESRKQIASLLGEDRAISIAGHRLTVKSIDDYMPDEHFPIENEGELVSRVYIALGRCNREAQILASASDSRGTSSVDKS